MDYTIPLWGIITVIGSFVIIVGWALIKMYFSDKSNKEAIAQNKLYFETALEKSIIKSNTAIEKIEKEMYYQEKAINSFKKEIDEKLDKYKIATDSKLSEINNIMVETKTLVKLLVDDRIK